MPFSRSGNVVTVTGSESIHSFYTDPANAGGMTRQGQSDRYQYYCDAYTFKINSGATFSIIDCVLSFGRAGSNNKLYVNGGTLIIGKEVTANSETLPTAYNTLVDMRCDASDIGTIFDVSASNIRVSTGSTVEIYSATIAFKEGNTRSDGNVTWKMRNVRWHNYGVSTAVRSLFIGALDIDGLELSSVSGDYLFIFNADATITQFKNFKPRQFGGVQFNANSYAFWREIEGYAPEASTKDIIVHQNGTNNRPFTRLISSVPGNSIVCNIQNPGDVGEGTVESVTKWDYTILDGVGTGIVGAGMYLLDANNGQRSHVSTSGAYLADREYTGIAGSGGVIPQLRPIINVYDREDGSNGFENTPLDIRTPLLQRIREYGKVWIDQEINSDQDQAASPRLQDNTNITQIAATAQAHTGITIDEGSFALFGGTFSIKVIGNLSTNPLLTMDDIYHYLQYHFSQIATTFNGRKGGAWHDMLLPDHTTVRGQYGGTRTWKGAIVVDQNDALFPGAGVSRDDTDSVIVGTVVVVSGQTVAIDISADIEVQAGGTVSGNIIQAAGRTALLDSFDGVSGIDLAGNTTVSTLTETAYAPDITGRATGNLTITSTSGWRYLDLRGQNITAGFTVTYNGPDELIVLQDTTDTPVTLAGTGTSSILTGIAADTVIQKSGSNYNFFAPVNVTVNDSGSSPISTAVVKFVDSGDNNRTYDGTFTPVTSLTTNGSGVATGYTLFRIDATEYTSQTMYIGKAGYDRLALPQTQNGTTIGSTNILPSDVFYTATPSSNTTINFGTSAITQAGNDTTQGIYDYAMQQWLSASNIQEVKPFVGAGAAFEIGNGYTMTIISGTVSGNAIQVNSGETLNLTGTGTMSANLSMAGGAAVSYNQSAFQGAINIASGTVTFNDLDGVTEITGTGENGGSIIVAGAATSQELSLKEYTVASTLFEVENISGTGITVFQKIGDTTPTKTETSGTITISASADITLPNLADGDAVWVYDKDGLATATKEIVAGGLGFSYTYTSTFNFRIIVRRKGKLPRTIEEFAGIDGYNNTLTLSDDNTYINIGIDGATVTGIAFVVGGCPVSGDDGFSLTAVSNTRTSQQLYTWQSYYTATLAGIDQRTEWITATVDGDISNYTWPDDLFWYNGNVTPTVTMTLTNAAHQKSTTGISISCGQYAETIPIYAATASDIQTQVGEIRDQLLDIEGTQDHNNLMRGMSAVLLGKASGGPDNSVFRDMNDTKDRVTVVADSDGDRSSVTLDLT